MKISQMPQSTTPSSDDVLAMLEGGTANKKVTFETLADWVIGEHENADLATTSKNIIDAINELDSRVGTLADNINMTWTEITANIAAGKLSLFNIGDTITQKWTDTSNSIEYDNPWRVNHIGDAELEDGTVLHGMYLENVFAHPFGVQFSHQRAFYRCPDGLTAGTYHIVLGANWGSKDATANSVWQFTLAQNVEAGGCLAGFYGMPDQASSNWKVYNYAADRKTVKETVSVTSGDGGILLGTLALTTRNGNLNSMHETAYGWNRWKTSALRQYLNSAAAAGAWWVPQDDWDIAPDQLSQKAGFLSGLSSDFINSLKPIKNTTYTNTVYDGGEADITYDKVSLISLEQMYVQPQIAGEGEAHDYWKRLNGTDSTYKTGSGNVYDEIKRYAVENQASAQNLRLRSAYRGNAISTWAVYTGGYVIYYYASVAIRFAPLVFIGAEKTA